MTKKNTIHEVVKSQTERRSTLNLRTDVAAALDQIASFRSCDVDALLAETVAIQFQAMAEEAEALSVSWRKRAEGMSGE